VWVGIIHCLRARTPTNLGVGHRAQEHIDADVPTNENECIKGTTEYQRIERLGCFVVKE
jgi:hypothetical protein